VDTVFGNTSKVLPKKVSTASQAEMQ